MYKFTTKNLLNKFLIYGIQTSRFYSRPRRALMYVPGNDLRKITKAFTLEADCIALDCEDGVAINKKDDARNTIHDILNKERPQRAKQYDLGVRINSVDTGFCKEDIKAVLSAKMFPDTVLLPKVENKDNIKWFLEETSKYSKKSKALNLIMYIESALGFINLVDICKYTTEKSSKYNVTPASLVFGSDDFCASIGVTRTEDSMEIVYARQKLVLVAKAFDLQAIDMVYIKCKDLNGLKRQAEEGARMGYTGKQVIHPDQIPIVQTAFSPNADQIDWARGLLKAFAEHQKSGKGAFTYEGHMIDMPTMKQAQNIVSLIDNI